VNTGGAGTAYQSGDTRVMGSAPITFYPKWTANTYNITYNANGAAGSPSRTSDTYTTAGSTISLPNVGTMARTGYNFAGWSVSSTGSIHDGPFTTTSDVTLFAIWTIKSINYSYDRGNAGGMMLTDLETTVFPENPNQAQYNSRFTLSSNIDSTITVGVDNYKFYGWFDGNTTYAAGASYVMPDATKTFTAQWAKLHAVRYSLNGGSGVLARDAECTQTGYTCLPNQVILLNDAPSRNGYTFAGWRNQENTETKLAGASVTVTEASYLWSAVWTPIPYQITFNSVGGSLSPESLTKNIGDSVVLPDPGTRTGYSFDGWLISSTVHGMGTNFIVGNSSVAFTAVWTPNRYNVSYNWNGGSGSGSSDLIYTVGTTPIDLPAGNARDGYVFDGWQITDTTTKLTSPYAPTADVLLEARWLDGAYTLTYNTFGGTQAISSSTVARATSLTLPIPTRTGFTFDGWYEDADYTLRYGAGSASVLPTASKSLIAKWVQNSLAGINPAHLNGLATLNIAGGSSGFWTGNHSQSGTGASLGIPAGALPNGTEVKVSFVEDLTRPADLIENSNAYFTSVVVHWLTGTGATATVPSAAANKPLTLTLTNPAIVAGAKVFSIIASQVTEVATAEVDGEVVITFYDDPEFVVAATRPGSPTAVTGTSEGDAKSEVTWSAPLGNGGSEVISYTVTSSPDSKTCTTSETSCLISGLTNGTSYTFTATAKNAIGTSLPSSVSASITPRDRFIYPVTFNSKGGSPVGNSSFVEDLSFDAPSEPTRSGYNFTGWATTDGNESTIVDFPYFPTTNAALTLYAIWSAIPQAITYDAGNGGAGTGPTAPATVLYDSTFTTPANTFSRTGYSFAGWNDGTSTFAAGARYPANGVVTGAVALTATWTADPQAITYLSGIGGSGTRPSAPATVLYDGTFTTPANTFSRTGYSFAGWYDGTSTFAAGAIYPVTGVVTGPVTLTATWSAIPQAITYASGSGGAGTGPTTPATVLYDATFTTPANTYSKTGYTFAGWSDGTTTYAVGDRYPATGGVTGPVTLTAAWNPNTQAITYAAGTGGSGTGPTTPATVLYDATFTTPANTFIRTGHTFAGWSDGTTTYAAGALYPASGGVTGPVTLTATWNADAPITPPTTPPTTTPTPAPTSSAAPSSTAKPTTSESPVPTASPTPTPQDVFANAPKPNNGIDVPDLGKANATIGDTSVETVVTVTEFEKQIEIGDSISISFQATDGAGNQIPTSVDGSVQVVQGATISASGQGFKAGSPVEAWLYSTPILLGSGLANPDGSFDNTYAINSEVPLGDHTVVLHGMSPEDEVITLALGVTVIEATTSPEIEQGSESGSGFDNLILGLMALLGAFLTAGLGVFAARVMRKSKK
jgi:uncharacterized repeat protein (TIGR02543 family)